MPHINRIRVNNVKYNFGTQYYDDFLMRFSCKNTIYDLANGGGKSVLMLLLLQNLIPNCTLDDKQPIEKLFRTSDGSKTIHSLIEWRLSDVHVNNNYKYMLTGFCARKAKDESGIGDDTAEQGETNIVRENASIEYFNYVIFYREFNDNDIKNLPLSKGKERITYNGLKAYLRELEKKDLSLEVKIFERKGDYQRFIAGYGLYESEWEIIRGINKTEGHVRTYFETNYKTTRKVVEDLLIEEIIEKSFISQTEGTGDNDYMAKTLLDIKDKLLELSAKKEDIVSFDRQIEIIDGFASRVQSIRQLYFGREDITENILKCFYTLKNLMSRDEENKVILSEKEDALIEEKTQIESLIESAKISGDEIEAKTLTEEIGDLINEQGLAAMELKRASEDLTVKESINDYADYLYYKNERDEIRELTEACLKDKSQLLSEVTELTGQVFNRINREQEDIAANIEKEEEILSREKETLEALSDAIKKYSEDIAVLNYLYEELGAKEQSLNGEILAKKNALSLYMVADIRDEISKVNKKLAETVEFNKKVSDDMEAAKLKKSGLEYAIHDLSLERDKANFELSENIDTRTRLAENSSKAEKLMEIYRVNNGTALVEDLRLRHKEAVLEEEVLNGSLSYKKLYLEQLKTGCPVGMSGEVTKVMEYMERYHKGSVIYGADFLKGKKKEEKQELLEKIPVLPYSIVVLKDYETITSDVRLKELELGHYAVPVISAKGIAGGSSIVNNMNMMFVMRDLRLFTEDSLVTKEIEKTKNEIENIGFKLESISKKVLMLQDDYDFAKEFETVYVSQIKEADERYEKLKYSLRETESKLLEKQKELKEVEKCIREFGVASSMFLENIATLERDAAELSDIGKLMKEAEEVSGKRSEAGINLKKTAREKEDAEARFEATKTQSGERRKYIEALKGKKEGNDLRLSSYKKYYKEGKYEDSVMDTSELEARLKGLVGALEKDSLDLKDKQKLMENYDIAMEKSLQAIDYKGLHVEEVKEKYDAWAGRVITKDELSELKEKIKAIKAKVDGYVANISHLRSKKDRLEGAIAHGKSLIEEKYGQYTPVTVENGDFEGFIQDKKNLKNGIAIELDKVKSELLTIQKNEGKYAVLEKDIIKIMDRAGISPSANVEPKDYGLSEQEFEEITSQVLEKFEKYTKDISDKKSEFEYERQLLSDTLRKLGAEPLSEEIRRSATMPQSVRDTDELIESLLDICKCLELEKDRVLKSIDDMEKIKDNFENQCIQTCINIKNELDRLPKQSKISMDDDVISIINLTVPYVKEDQYKFRMSQYIDETTKTADELKNEAERIKYIKNRLSWKKLFSVIVTDMNGIKLNLYKRERIKEQSRYLKYEEAVGSTGQSQGIYIQFLIAIINYIASINSKDKDTGLRKVIFIDNPFGAAKDIYIWEPIFKLLKTNNVQLVVPARGVTPAITGRFDVNYILGQKIIDGRQQTVVVDYSSHVDNEKMDYTKLEFEQATLF